MDWTSQKSFTQMTWGFNQAVTEAKKICGKKDVSGSASELLSSVSVLEVLMSGLHNFFKQGLYALRL